MVILIYFIITGYKLNMYNTNYLIDILPKLNKDIQNKIKKECLRSINILTSDIQALLQLYNHFSENKKCETSIIDHAQYIWNNYFNNKHIWLTNYFTILSILGHQ